MTITGLDAHEKTPIEGRIGQGDTRSLGGETVEGVVRATLADQTGRGLISQFKAVVIGEMICINQKTAGDS